jgi:hypothetical protein
MVRSNFVDPSVASTELSVIAIPLAVTVSGRPAVDVGELDIA